MCHVAFPLSSTSNQLQSAQHCTSFSKDKKVLQGKDLCNILQFPFGLSKIGSNIHGKIARISGIL